MRTSQPANNIYIYILILGLPSVVVISGTGNKKRVNVINKKYNNEKLKWFPKMLALQLPSVVIVSDSENETKR